jgi:hypothetical protein
MLDSQSIHIQTVPLYYYHFISLQIRIASFTHQHRPSSIMEQSTLHRRGLGLRGVNHGKVSLGYTLFAHLTSPGVVKLVDNDSWVVHTWDLPYRPGRHVRILKNGNLAFNGVHPYAPGLFPL